MGPADRALFGDANGRDRATTLAEIAAQFYNFKVKHDWTAKTAADVKRVLALASSVIGPEKQMRSLNIEEVKAVRDAIAQVPPNYMKSNAEKGLNILQAIASNDGGRHSRGRRRTNTLRCSANC